MPTAVVIRPVVIGAVAIRAVVCLFSETKLLESSFSWFEQLHFLCRQVSFDKLSSKMCQPIAIRAIALWPVEPTPIRVGFFKELKTIETTLLMLTNLQRTTYEVTIITLRSIEVVYW